MNVVPPDVGAVHQLNLEYLSRVVQESQGFIYPDSVVGTDSHTTMINGLGILGWGKEQFKVLSMSTQQPILAEIHCHFFKVMNITMVP